jgi:hypothetical protein
MPGWPVMEWNEGAMGWNCRLCTAAKFIPCGATPAPAPVLPALCCRAFTIPAAAS